MIINRESLKALNAGFSKVFNNYLETHKGTYSKFTTEVISKSVTVNYAWLGSTSKMREWIGDRVLKDLTAHTYAITRKKFESTIEVDRDDIEGDNLGVVKPRIETMAYDATTHYDEIVNGVLEANGICYDGKNFFATNHSVGGINFSNLGTKKLSAASLNAARQEMMALVNPEGQPLVIKPSLLVIPQTLESTARGILLTEKLANGASNPNYKLMDFEVNPYLTDENAWYLFDVTRPLKPIILQKYENIVFTAMDKEDDENVFMRDTYRYGTRAKDNAGYGLWQQAYKSTGADA